MLFNWGHSLIFTISHNVVMVAYTDRKNKKGLSKATEAATETLSGL